MNCQKTPGPRPREILTLARDRKLTLQTQTWAPLARWQERVLHWSCQFNQLCQRSPTRKLFCRHSYPLTIYGSHHLYMLLVWCFEAFLATWPHVSTSHVICLQLELSTLTWLLLWVGAIYRKLNWNWLQHKYNTALTWGKMNHWLSFPPSFHLPLPFSLRLTAYPLCSCQFSKHLI